MKFLANCNKFNCEEKFDLTEKVHNISPCFDVTRKVFLETCLSRHH